MQNKVVFTDVAQMFVDGVQFVSVNHALSVVIKKFTGYEVINLPAGDPFLICDASEKKLLDVLLKSKMVAYAISEIVATQIGRERSKSDRFAELYDEYLRAKRKMEQIAAEVWADDLEVIGFDFSDVVKWSVESVDKIEMRSVELEPSSPERAGSRVRWSRDRYECIYRKVEGPLLSVESPVLERKNDGWVVRSLIGELCYGDTVFSATREFMRACGLPEQTVASKFWNAVRQERD